MANENIKIEALLYDNIYQKYIYVINEIESENEIVKLPKAYKDYLNIKVYPVTHVGIKYRPDTRTEDERWEDEYRGYRPQTNSFIGREVKISPNVKQIIVPPTVRWISDEAFANTRGLTFVFEEENERYEFVDDCLYDKKEKRVIYKK